ncbi:unnamed protein product [Closterium sp. Yama58-4]|nr:unnamed protein product [Closterium sp. Yama58-4]
MKRQLADGDWGVRTLADDFLFRDGNIDKVPEINSVGVDHVPVGSLVRFRGMVQDMWGTEFYQGLYKRSRQPPSASPSASSASPSPPWRTTKYTDGDCGGAMGGDGAEGLGEGGREGAADFGSIWERWLLYCVPVSADGRLFLAPHSTPHFLSPLCLILNMVPGEQPWARALRDGGREGRGNCGRGEGGSGGEEGSGAEKRGREEGDAEPMVGLAVRHGRGNQGGSRRGRGIQETGTGGRPFAFTYTYESTQKESKRQATSAVTNTTDAAIPTNSNNTPAQPNSTASGDPPPFVDLHFPLGPSTAAASPHGRPLLPCIVKLYDSVESQLKLNQVVEFVGVVAPPSAPTVHAHTAAAAAAAAAQDAATGAGTSTGAGMEVEMMGGDMGMGVCPSACLPSSQVLRLHCLTWRKLPHLFQPAMEPTVASVIPWNHPFSVPSSSLGPALYSLFPISRGPPDLPSLVSPLFLHFPPPPHASPLQAAASIRAALLSRLAAVLGGDRLAAEYLLLHLLSRVHTRIEPMPLGKLSLNLSGFPEPSSPSTPSPTPPPLSSSPPSLAQAASPSLSTLSLRPHLLSPSPPPSHRHSPSFP